MAKKRRPSLSRLTVIEIASELQRRRAALPQLHAQRKELVAELQQIDAAIAALDGSYAPGRGGRGGGSGNRPRAATGGRRRAKNDTNLPDALVKVLSGKTMSVSDAAAAVVKAGYKTSSKHFRTMVNIALLNKKKFKRVERGLYTAV
ncbi:MAG: hypothetical protein AB7G11_03620 [Phycisphaerales bacterium]